MTAQPGTRQSIARPVNAQALRMQRNGRVLLSVDNIEVGESGCTVIVGPNGAGKSLLVRTLCNLQQPDEGMVFWARKPPDRARRHKVGLLLQRPVLLQRSALANLIYALRQTGVDTRSSREHAQQALKAAGLSAVADVHSGKLSGGEQQRLALSRALLLEPEILFLDEATANVDPASTLLIEQQLKRAMARGLSVVMISHDIGQVKRMADYVVLMHQGNIVEYASKMHFFDQSVNLQTCKWIAGELLV